MKYTTNIMEPYRLALKALSKYNRLAYKEVVLHMLPDLHNGHFWGELKDGVYTHYLHCDYLFEKVHGKVYIQYRVNEDTHVIDLLTIEPNKLLLELHNKLSTIRSGIPITNEADAFKVNLLNKMRRT